MKFKLDDFSLETSTVEVVHPTFGDSGAFVELRPMTDPDVATASDIFRAGESSPEAVIKFVDAIVVGWPVDANEFFYGLDYSSENLEEVLRDPRSVWLAAFVLQAVVNPENFTSSQLRKLAK